MPDRPYAAHEALVAPARPSAALWRLVLGMIAIAALAFLLSGMLQALLAVLAPGGLSAPTGPGATPGDTPGEMLVLLGSFGLVTLSVAVAVRLLHQRGLASVMGPRARFLGQFRAVLLWLLAVGAAVVVLTPQSLDAPLEPNLPPGLWLALLPVSLLAVLVQTSAEEILFRGYVQQQLAARFRQPWVWLVLPSALFGLGHFLPGQAGPNAALIAAWAGLFGLLMADITARAGTLGPAIAIHFVNNLAALLIIALPDGLSGLALYTVPYSMTDPEAMRAALPVDFAGMLVAWLAARVAIRR